MTFIENARTLAEVAEVTRRTEAQVEAEAVQLGLYVGADWGGRPALSEWDASQLSSGLLRKQQESDREWLQHREATAKWETDRRAVYLTAHAEAYREAGGAMAGRRSDLAAQRAGDASVEVWQRKNPAPRWHGEATASLWRRVVDAVSAAVS